MGRVFNDLNHQTEHQNHQWNQDSDYQIGIRHPCLLWSRFFCWQMEFNSAKVAFQQRQLRRRQLLLVSFTNKINKKKCKFIVCCTALSTSNPTRVTAPTGTPGASLDECAVLRRIQRGACPSTAQIVCSAARNMQVSQIILQFLSGSTVVASATGTTRASGTITCTSSGWQVTNTAGSLVAFTSVSCNQVNKFQSKLIKFLNF